MTSLPRRIVVLRLEHRPERDKRLTTHLGLTARAFGAEAFWVSGVPDQKIVDVLERVCEHWGLRAFEVQMGVSWRDRIREWKRKKGEVVHLTMYGVHVDDTIAEIRESPRDKLIVVGGPKVPAEVFDLADYNVAVGHQPHSEVAALAVFLDRLSQGDELRAFPEDAKFVIEPMRRGKRVRKRER
jgi:tRNA (cytidine56-2'-O)-methyltransferase